MTDMEYLATFPLEITFDLRSGPGATRVHGHVRLVPCTDCTGHPLVEVVENGSSTERGFPDLDLALAFFLHMASKWVQHGVTGPEADAWAVAERALAWRRAWRAACPRPEGAPLH